MGKVAGVVAVVFTMGMGAVQFLGVALGGRAESAGLGLMGLGLFASSQLLHAKLSPARTHTPAAQP